MIHHGDCIEVMAGMDPESVDAVVTDPPYGLRFMSKAWDDFSSEMTGGWEGALIGAQGGMHSRGVVDLDAAKMQRWHEAWARQALRVAKPSAYLLAFGGTRTVHRMTCALEDAGWIIRDMLVWGYASGFPKSKASLKPAWEPIVMARKPGPLRMLAIDECRLPVDPHDAGREGEASASTRYTDEGGTNIAALPGPRGGDPTGRWPANIVLTDPIFDGEPRACPMCSDEREAGPCYGLPDHPERCFFDSVVGAGRDRAQTATYRNDSPNNGYHGIGIREAGTTVGYGDTGTYSRFFLIPKAARSDREPVLGGLPERVVNITEGHGLGPVNTSKGDGTGIRENRARANVHPTVKPVDLMRHLVRLVTPTGGTVLDPFLGSGTTAIAAEMEGFEWFGIEREAEYVAIAEARLNGTQRGLGLGA